MFAAFNQKPSRTEDESINANSLEIDPEFESVLRQNLQEFRDGDTDTIKLPQQSFAESELSCVRQVATDLGLFVHERGSGCEQEVLVSKKTEL